VGNFAKKKPLKIFSMPRDVRHVFFPTKRTLDGKNKKKGQRGR
jgi:hypothetical protein